MARILIADSDSVACEVLRTKLEREGYATDIAQTGLEALERARVYEPDLIILEVELPELDGFAACRILRFERDTPILMLTARKEEVDRVHGLDMGADDYVVKPFLPNELLARIRALLRRGARSPLAPLRQILTLGALLLDLTSHRAFRDNEEVHLSQKEFDLLACFMQNQGVILSRDMLLEQVWGEDFKNDARTVDVHVRWLRAKIEPDAAHPQYIHTVRGLGYRFLNEPQDQRVNADWVGHALEKGLESSHCLPAKSPSTKALG
jgi:DNA-binding response OmpR family regulator